jgi:glycosyltransferase involved in cell wall biosynthesis
VLEEDAPAAAPWPVVDVVIPALDEEAALPLVLAAIPRAAVRTIVVVDNGSADRTAEVARAGGAFVVSEPRRGYGRACLTGIAVLAARPPVPEVVVFLDADASDRPELLPELVRPIADGSADFVVGSRVLGACEPGALLPQQRLGNLLAAWLIRRLHGLAVTDLGPFRAIRWDTLLALGMRDPDFGWTAEMQVRAARAGVRYREVPAPCRRRIGSSKIAGTVAGSLRAGYKILLTVARHSRPGGGPPHSPSPS